MGRAGTRRRGGPATLAGAAARDAAEMGTEVVNASFQMLVLKGSREMGCEIKSKGLEEPGHPKGGAGEMGRRRGETTPGGADKDSQSTGDGEEEEESWLHEEGPVTVSVLPGKERLVGFKITEEKKQI